MDRLQYKLHLIIENQNISEREIIDELNSQFVQGLIPTIVYLVLLFIVGIPGNGLVCYIYRSTYADSNSNWFMFFLAAMDLILCVFLIPVEIASICFKYNFKSDILCKSSKFLGLWSIFSLALIMVIGSIDRYRKVCRPLNSQIDFRKAKNLSFGAVIFGFVISAPVIFVYGIYEFKIDAGVFNVTAYECSYRKADSESSTALYYILFGMTLFTAVLATICILYVFIGKAIKQYTNSENARQSVSLRSSVTEQHQIIDSDSSKIKLKTVRICHDDIHVPTMSVMIQSTADGTLNGADENLGNHSGKGGTCKIEKPMVQVRETKAATLDRKHSRYLRKSKARQATLSMILISVAFVLSYLPLLSLSLIRSLVPGIRETLSDGENAVYSFFLRSWFLSWAINPFIYGIADSKFRGNCGSVICQMYDRVLRFIKNSSLVLTHYHIACF